MIRERFKELQAYKAPYITEGIKLDANENPYPIPKALIEHMKAWTENMSISRYPDTNSTDLCEAIAKAYDVNPENVVCGVGSDQLIDCILRATLDEGDKVMAPGPSFSMYKQSAYINSGQLIEVDLEADFSYNVGTFIEAVKEHSPKVIFLCSPNNPTGGLLEIEDLEAILEVATGLVVLDEAYGEFAKLTTASLTQKYNHLIVLKTFSKAYSLAGARVGYGIAQEKIIEMINKVRPPYNLDVYSQEVALWAITHREVFAESIHNIIEDRAYLAEGLTQKGIKVYASQANFLWLETPLLLDDILAQENIFIKKMYYKEKPYYRMSIGTREENRRIATLLNKL